MNKRLSAFFKSVHQSVNEKELDSQPCTDMTLTRASTDGLKDTSLRPTHTQTSEIPNRTR